MDDSVIAAARHRGELETATAAAAGAPVRADRRRVWLAITIGLAIFAGLASLAVERNVFPLGSANRDESTYVAAATMARQGRFTLPAASHEDFRPWAAGRRGDRIVLKYLPPWPVTLAAFDTVGARGLAAPVMASLLVLLVYALTRELVGGAGPEPTVAAAAVALSPLVAFQGGTVLPYLFQLVLEVAAGLLLVRSRRVERRAEVVLAGLLFGVALFARQFDAIVTVAPFVVVACWKPAGEDDGAPAHRTGSGWLRATISWLGRLHWARAGWFALGAVVPVAGLLAFDAVVMGSPLRLPFTVTGTSDALGFGARGVFRGSTVPFSPFDGLLGTVLNLAWFSAWTAGGPLLAAAAVVGWRRSPRSPARTALGALALVIPIAFVPFWGTWAVVHFWPGTMTLGPFYHLALLLPLAVFGGVGAVDVARRLRARSTSGDRLVALAAAGVVVVTALLVPPKLTANATYTRRFRAAASAVGAVPAPSLVLMPDRGVNGFDSWTPSLQNSPALDQARLYADDRGSNVFALLDRFPDRHVERLTMSPADAPTSFHTEPVTLVRGDVIDLTIATRAPGAGASAFLVDGGRETSRRPVTTSTVWRVTPGSVRNATGVLALGVDVPRGRSHSRWEVRVPYRRTADGNLELLLPARGFRRVKGVWQERDVADVVSVASWHVGAEQGQ